MRRRFAASALGLAVSFAAPRSDASEIGHYVGGLANIRDLAVPADPGFYVAVYNYGYVTSRLNDARGREIDSATLVGPRGRRLTLNVDIDVELYALAPLFMWVSDWNILGARYAAYVGPSFSNTSIAAALSLESRTGRQVDTGGFGVGDLYVQPVWLGWGLEHFDFAFGLGFYAPVGKYDVRTVDIPRLGEIKAEAATNIGLGFWTQQTQLSGYWYPWANKATAVALALTHEVNGKKEDFDITPGQNLTLNWGVSQYLPLTTDQTLLLEIGPAGYDTWQVTEDSGDDVSDPGVKDEVHAVGGQIGLTYVPWTLVVNLHYFHEYEAVDRFEGEAFGLTVAKKF